MEPDFQQAMRGNRGLFSAVPDGHQSAGRHIASVYVQANIHGSWYSFEGERIGQGRENVKIFLIDNPDIFEKIEFRVREQLGIATPGSNGAKKEAK